MAELDIDFVLLDESVVQYGFRVLMNGVQLEGFKKNPVMLFMHSRATNGIFNGALPKNSVLPIGKWYDIRIEGDKLLAKPEFDDDDDFAKTIEKKVQKGYLNAASVALEPFAVSDEEQLKLKGQPGVTVTKSGIGEASIVDMPNCRNALAIRNNTSNKTISLSLDGGNEDALQFLNSLLPKNPDMDKKLLAAKLGLPEAANDAEITAKLTAVLGDAGKVVGLNAQVVQLEGDKQALEIKLANFETAQREKEINDLVELAAREKKITTAQVVDFKTLAAADFNTAKKILDGMKPYESVQTQLADATTGVDAETAELMKLSGEELWKTGKLETLKAKNLEGFKQKYKEFFGTEYAGK